MNSRVSWGGLDAKEQQLVIVYVQVHVYSASLYPVGRGADGVDAMA
jgi:hypothetical protein